MAGLIAAADLEHIRRSNVDVAPVAAASRVDRGIDHREGTVATMEAHDITGEVERTGVARPKRVALDPPADHVDNRCSDAEVPGVSDTLRHGEGVGLV
ncbi:MAG TPA: hypothetical protein VIZ22_06230, partial [Candidatus Limnocylindrales bacterium]